MVLKDTVMEVTNTAVLRAMIYKGGQVVALQATDGQFYWTHGDHLGSSRRLTNTSGTVTYKGEFSPFGEVLTEWNAGGGNNLNVRKFTGYERDASGLDYAKARMYSNSRARFTRPDPAGLRSADSRPQSLNLYTYTGNDPVNKTDPSGMFGEYPGDRCVPPIVNVPPAILDYYCRNGVSHPLYCPCNGNGVPTGPASDPRSNPTNNPYKPPPILSYTEKSAKRLLGENKCGHAGWEIAWVIENGGQGINGWIVQHIIVEVEIKGNKDRKVRSNNRKANFFEAWLVKDGVAYINYNANELATDEFITADEDEGTYGTVMVTAYARFLQGYILQVPPWNSPKAPQAGRADSRDNSDGSWSPEGWSDDGSLKRTFTVEVECKKRPGNSSVK
jgi:RHS repeat-associated protein